MPPREPGELSREEGQSLRLWLLVLWPLPSPLLSLLLLLLLLLFSFSRLLSWLWSPALGRTSGEWLMPRIMFSTRARLARRCSSDSRSNSKEERERGWEGAWELRVVGGGGRPKEEEEDGGGRGGPGERQSDGLSRSREELLQASSAWISEPPLDRAPLPCDEGQQHWLNNNE